VVGSLCGVAGFGILATIGPGTDYLTVLVPGLVLCGLCTGVACPVVSGTAMVGVSERDAGAAGGMVNVAQQVTSLIDGYATGLAACAGLMAVATVVAATTLRVARRRPARRGRRTRLTRGPRERRPGRWHQACGGACPRAAPVGGGRDRGLLANAAARDRCSGGGAHGRLLHRVRRGLSPCVVVDREATR
jgi:hypothetical protein